MFDRSPRLRARFGVPLSSLGLLAALMCLPACEPEECSVNFELSGAIDWSWVWRHPTTTCEVKPEDGLGGVPGLEFINDDEPFLRLAMAENSIAIGTWPATVTYGEDFFTTWTSEGTATSCLVTITSHEIVDWVQHDRHRLRGTLACSGPLVSPEDGSQLTLSAVEFSIYAPDTNDI